MNTTQTVTSMTARFQVRAAEKATSYTPVMQALIERFPSIEKINVKTENKMFSTKTYMTLEGPEATVRAAWKVISEAGLTR